VEDRLVYIPYAHGCPVASGMAKTQNLMDIEAISSKSHWTFGLSSGMPQRQRIAMHKFRNHMSTIYKGGEFGFLSQLKL